MVASEGEFREVCPKVHNGRWLGGRCSVTALVKTSGVKKTHSEFERATNSGSLKTETTPCRGSGVSIAKPTPRPWASRRKFADWNAKVGARAHLLDPPKREDPLGETVRVIDAAEWLGARYFLFCELRQGIPKTTVAGHTETTHGVIWALP